MLSLYMGVAKWRIASPKSPLLLSALCALLAGAALSGCVYDPYYAVYDPAPQALPYYYPYGYGYTYGYGYGRPAYVGPPITFNFGYSHYSHHGHNHHGGHGGSGWHGHGWGGGHGGYHGGAHGGGHGGHGHR